ncbi:macrophage mannose receptor 1 isoform X2 [Misgurnus anguillicaudatus]|uniref:macrophage mannose receptor 1 isoform X2 n=1 Tax=Misgurnus anguillicaudatus TaxID=75329 RepID=UPI003CCF4A9C
MKMLQVFVLISLCVAVQPSSQTDDNSFLIYNEDHNRCVNVINADVVYMAPCDVSSDAQRFRWVSSSRIISVSLKLCLGAQSVKDFEKVILLPCKELSPLQSWECKSETLFGLKEKLLYLNYGHRGDQNMMLYIASGSWSHWQIYGEKYDLCFHEYQEIYTLGGNAFGKPCQFPFKFNDKWYAECITEGRSDGKLWCSTETDYDTEMKWGFCPTKTGKDQPNFCPVAWVPYAGHCYYLQRTKKTWSDALAACHREGSDLASIHNIEEHSFIISKTGYMSTDELWIGLNDQRIQNQFEWSDRSHVTFTKWFVGEPSPITNRMEDCVLIKGKEGKWSDHLCESTHGYICKKKASTKPEGSPEVISPGCPAGWFRFGYYCYNVAMETKTFDDAKLTCEQAAANLVDVGSRNESAFLISLVGLRPEKYFWIGLSNTHQTEQFQWINGAKVKFTHFNVGMPDKHKGCVAMLTGTSAGLWDVLACNTKQKYICKKMAEGVTTTREPPTTRPPSCPDNWIKKDPDNCVKIYRNKKEKKKTWFEARDFCRAIGGDLASFHSKNEINLLPTLYSSTEDAWIGLNSLDSKSGFVWSDQTPLDYENWRTYRPNYKNNHEYCVDSGPFWYGYIWEDRDCDVYNDWICQIPIGITPKSPPTSVIQEFNKTSDGWIQYNGSQYFINKERHPMEEARDFCKKNHADLVVINGQTERRFLWKQISRSEGSQAQYYIGMTVELDKSFSWVDGSPVVYTAWERNEPNFANNDENCVTVFKSTGLWNDINCGYSLPSICKRSDDFVNTTMSPTTLPAGGCAPEWTLFRGKCYKFFDNTCKMSWQKSRDHCISNGGNLVSVRSHTEQFFLTTLMLSAVDDVWIGLNDIASERNFMWTDNRAVRYTNWLKGQPPSSLQSRHFYDEDYDEMDEDYFEMEVFELGPMHHQSAHHTIEYMNYDCVVMVKHPEKSTGMWKVEDCKDERGFICKRNTDSQLSAPVTKAVPHKYFSLGNDSYKVQLEKMSWDEARRQCKADDADLASVLDSISQAYTSLQVDKLKEPLWIGLNSKLTGGRYRWVDNWLLSYSKWATGEPKNNLACVYIDTDGDWKTAACNNKYYSLCKRSTVFVPTDPPQLPGNCPESDQSWIPFRGHCYTFMTSMSDIWAHATVECMRMGASLVSIEDPIESQFIRQNLEILQDEVKSVWIGLHRSHMGDWMWIDNTVVDYTNWKPRMPDDVKICVEVQSETGMWSTNNCDDQRGYICKTAKVIPPTEKPSVSVTPTTAKLSVPDPQVYDKSHVSAGIAVGVMLVIIAVVGLAGFLFFKRNPRTLIGWFDSKFYNNLPEPITVFDSKEPAAN